MLNRSHIHIHTYETYLHTEYFVFKMLLLNPDLFRDHMLNPDLATSFLTLGRRL